ncbi:MAG: DUF2318 domain-containing protein [Nitrospirae bacterium]|nr:DUF2318 domain-containing protein [Nitrospirota bacterium]
MKQTSISVMFISFLLLFVSCSKSPARYQNALVRDSRVVISLSDVSDGKVHFYTYSKSGKQVNFFVRTDGKGTVSSYYDACFTCYKKKKGYRQEGPDLICNECSMKFGVAEEKWEEKDGCNPIYLKSSIEGNNLVIDTAVIEKGAKLF